MGKNIINVTDQNFNNEVLESELPVLVDFWAPWCAPCRMIAPIVEELANEFSGKLKVAKLNTDENFETATKYGIMSIPTLAIFVGGEVLDGVVGAVPKQILKDKINSILLKAATKIN